MCYYLGLVRLATVHQNNLFLSIINDNNRAIKYLVYMCIFNFHNDKYKFNIMRVIKTKVDMQNYILFHKYCICNQVYFIIIFFGQQI